MLYLFYCGMVSEGKVNLHLLVLNEAPQTTSFVGLICHGELHILYLTFLTFSKGIHRGKSEVVSAWKKSMRWHFCMFFHSLRQLDQTGLKFVFVSRALKQVFWTFWVITMFRTFLLPNLLSAIVLWSNAIMLSASAFSGDVWFLLGRKAYAATLSFSPPLASALGCRSWVSYSRFLSHHTTWTSHAIEATPNGEREPVLKL